MMESILGTETEKAKGCLTPRSGEVDASLVGMLRDLASNILCAFFIKESFAIQFWENGAGFFT